jgi:signal transduction histidine kinase
MSVITTEPVAIDLAENLGVDDLRDLMRAVTETTERLQTTHVALHAQVAQLQQELTEANLQLRRSRSLAALGEMAAGIAHEVRNPLASIHLYAQMLGEDLADRPNQAELCHKITRAVVGLDSIVRDVLSFARETSVHCEPLNAADLLDRAVENCESMVREGDVKIVTHIKGDGLVMADPNLMVQALANVVRNAVEAMIEGQSPRRELKLEVARRRLRCPDGERALRVVFSLIDSGPGIPDAVLDRVFNPFFTTRKTGTGLGLAIVHRIIDAHGGHVSIHNIPTGGTHVSLCIPALQSARSIFHPLSESVS